MCVALPARRLPPINRRHGGSALPGGEERVIIKNHRRPRGDQQAPSVSFFLSRDPASHQRPVQVTER